MEKENVETKATKGERSAIRNIRIVQAIFLGILTLGFSMVAGDYNANIVAKPWLSTLSIVTTLFGFMGTVICEVMSRRAMDW